MSSLSRRDLDMWDDLRDYTLLEGDCLEKMKELESNSIDAIITDPPYGIGFMGKDWDSSVPGLEWAKECYRVLKPGGHIVAFSGTRTIHRLAVAIEDAGFEIRDTIHWCYTSGFPKSNNISKQFDREAGLLEPEGKKTTYEDCERVVYNPTTDPREYVPPEPQSELAKKYKGFGTGLKPAIEPATLARKPIERGLSVARNVAKYGVGALNIDASRFAYGDDCWIGPQEWSGDPKGDSSKSNCINHIRLLQSYNKRGAMDKNGRWPANIFQCSKPSRSEREAGLDHLDEQVSRSNMNTFNGEGERFDGASSPNYSNFHPTVKPVKLFRWLCRLLGGLRGNTILDPFCGSGTTGVSAILEGFHFIGIEREPRYIPIIKGRIDWAREEYKRENAQLSLFSEVS
jgi:site-specific DNA-methyltransferase (adenine-specific)